MADAKTPLPDTEIFLDVPEISWTQTVIDQELPKRIAHYTFGAWRTPYEIKLAEAGDAAWEKALKLALEKVQVNGVNLEPWEQQEIIVYFRQNHVREHLADIIDHRYQILPLNEEPKELQKHRFLSIFMGAFNRRFVPDAFNRFARGVICKNLSLIRRIIADEREERRKKDLEEAWAKLGQKFPKAQMPRFFFDIGPFEDPPDEPSVPPDRIGNPPHYYYTPPEPPENHQAQSDENETSRLINRPRFSSAMPGHCSSLDLSSQAATSGRGGRTSIDLRLGGNTDVEGIDVQAWLQGVGDPGREARLFALVKKYQSEQ